MASTAARILIAEDDEHTRTLLAELCSASGYEVEACGDGEAALERMRANRPDLVLLDIMMPRLDGYQVLSRLRADPALRDLPAVVITANGDTEDKVRGLQHGADDYLTKPFRLAEVQARIKACLAMKRYRSLLEQAEAELAELRTMNIAPGGFAEMRQGLAYELERARRYKRPLSALMISVEPDVSSPRAAADADGAALSDLLKRELRSPDRVYRLDVEEFVILLPETDETGARTAAGRLLAALDGKDIAHQNGSRVRLNLWIGHASFPGVADADTLLVRANEALKAARQSANRKIAG